MCSSSDAPTSYKDKLNRQAPPHADMTATGHDESPRTNHSRIRMCRTSPIPFPRPPLSRHTLSLENLAPSPSSSTSPQACPAQPRPTQTSACTAGCMHMPCPGPSERRCVGKRGRCIDGDVTATTPHIPPRPHRYVPSPDPPCLPPGIPAVWAWLNRPLPNVGGLASVVRSCMFAHVEGWRVSI